MRLLLDTHLLLRAAGGMLTQEGAAMVNDPANELFFSAASIWEIAIKGSLGRPDFRADARLVLRGLLDAGYVHLPVTASHAAAVSGLPALHKDPFDRILVAQASVEGIMLLTSDAKLAAYPGPVRVMTRRDVVPR